MKTPLLFLSAALAIVTGCGESSNKSAQQTNSTSAVNAPADYLGAVGQAQNYAVRTADLAPISEAIRMFNAENGRNPKDLNELVQQKYLPRLPKAPAGSKFVYDPATGKVGIARE
ncbi:MAG TPA: hypothetical protein VFM25_08615 [Verrucomicrobiae bacterium]|jgi:hypothetical protein|nr:hypothetical protein [Verrucomicrobiae bacterium]